MMQGFLNQSPEVKEDLYHFFSFETKLNGRLTFGWFSRETVPSKCSCSRNSGEWQESHTDHLGMVQMLYRKVQLCISMGNVVFAPLFWSYMGQDVFNSISMDEDTTKNKYFLFKIGYMIHRKKIHEFEKDSYVGVSFLL
jgi:hypothetical protein